jgi:cell division protein FtsL
MDYMEKTAERHEKEIDEVRKMFAGGMKMLIAGMGAVILFLAGDIVAHLQYTSASSQTGYIANTKSNH